LRLVPNATAGKPVAAVVAPALDPAAMEPGNGGAAAPAEPPADGLDPVEPPVAEDPVGDGGAVGATSGPPPAPAPAPGDSAAPSDPPPVDAAPAPPPAATSVAPAASTTPPTSATTGGAQYAPPRRS